MAIRKTRFILVGAIVIFLLLVLLLRMTPQIEKGTILQVQLHGQIDEEEPSDLGSAFFDTEARTLRELVDAIELASSDERVAALSLEIETGVPFAMTQELRAALAAFAATGKPCLVYLGDAGNLDYFLASACPQVFMAPTGNLYLSGLMASQTFYRGFFDKLDIYPDVYGIAEYKTARNQYTEKGFTGPHREMLLSILEGLQDQIVEGIAAGRSMEKDAVSDLLSRGPFLGREAAEQGLVDALLYADEYLDRLAEVSGSDDPDYLSPGEYLSRVATSGGPRIAIVYGTGVITTGENGDSFLDGRLMGGQTIARAIREAREDSSIRAVVFRINSPGGSPLGSEMIRRELELTKASKPVVVSMSNYAASGGYWIAMSSDKILADPGTLTGSIGVVFGKLDIEGLYNYFGFTKDHVALTPNATFFYPFEKFTPEQRRAAMRIMRDIYQTFIEGVAHGREMSVEDVEKIARGRVWLGSQAVANGLVDELGGLQQAVATAKQLADIPAGSPVSRVILPRPKSGFELLEEMFSGRSTRAFLLDEVRQLEKIHLYREQGWVLIPFWPDIR